MSPALVEGFLLFAQRSLFAALRCAGAFLAILGEHQQLLAVERIIGGARAIAQAFGLAPPLFRWFMS
jgi:hypothetical protein